MFLSCLFLISLPLATECTMMLEAPQDEVIVPALEHNFKCKIVLPGKTPVKWMVRYADDFETRIIGEQHYGQVGVIYGGDVRYSRYRWTGYKVFGAMELDYTNFGLTIPSAKFEDSGEFICFHSWTVQGSAFLQVSQSKEMIFFRMPSNVRVSVGTSAGFKCKVDYNTAVKWRVRLASGTSYNIKAKQQATRDQPSEKNPRVSWDWKSKDPFNYDIVISNTQAYDRGAYRCIATAHDGATVYSRWAHLEVGADTDPEFVTKPKNVVTIELNAITLTCRVRVQKSGEIIVRWTKAADPTNNNPMDLGFRHNSSRVQPKFSWAGGGNNYDIHFKHVKKSDAGFYSCEALPKQHGVSDKPISAGATLDVIEKHDSLQPKAVPMVSKTAVSFKVGSFPVLPCKIDNDLPYCCPPTPRVMWVDEDMNILTDGEERVSNDSRLLVSTANYTGPGLPFKESPHGLVIEGAALGDAQIYYCVLVNTERPVWQAVQLHIIGCPSSWVHNTQLRKCYGGEHEQVQIAFGDAEQRCRQDGAHLAMAKTQHEAGAVVDAARTILGEHEGEMWIGLDYIAKSIWKWVDGRDLFKDVFDDKHRRWGPGKPSDRKSIAPKDCAKMIFSDQTFEDEWCWTKNRAFCETSDLDYLRNKKKALERCPGGWTYFDCGEFCYQRSENKHSWAGAALHCAELQASLAMPRTPRQLRAVRKALKVPLSLDVTVINLEAWIGLWALEGKTYRTFNWIDGTFVDGLNWWELHKPGSKGNCISIDPYGKYQLYRCRRQKYFVCQKPQNVLTSHFPPSCGVTTSHLIKKRDIGFNIHENLNNMKLNLSTLLRNTDIMTRKKAADSNTNIRAQKRDVDSNTNMKSQKRVVDSNTNTKSKKRDVDSNTNMRYQKRDVMTTKELFGDVINFADFPWTVAIYVDKRFHYNGVLIGPKHVLTSATSVTDDDGREVDKFKVKVRLFSDNTYFTDTSKSSDLPYDSKNLEAVHMIKIHKDFRNEKLTGGQYHTDYDVAIIELRRTLHLSCPRVTPACYPIQQNPPYGGQTCALGGLLTDGQLESYCVFDGSGLKQRGTTNIVFKQPNCVAHSVNVGSPLVCTRNKGQHTDDTYTEGQWTLSGVTVYRKDTGSNTGPAFIDVYSMTPWIHSVVKELTEGHKFYTIMTKRATTYSQAKTICQEYGGKLPEPRNEGENSKLAKLGVVHRMWLGLTDRHIEGTWIYDSDRTVASYVDWMKWTTSPPPEPNGKFAENCVVMMNDDNAWRGGHRREGWADQDCDRTSDTEVMHLKVVCEKVGPSVHMYYETVCNGGHLSVACDYGRPPAIEVVTATYGRGSLYRCIQKRPTDTSCNSDVKAIISNKCDGKNVCDFVVNAELLGNPCPQTIPYFQMTYKCVDSELHERVSEDGLHFRLNCGLENRLVIRVTSATFGRDDQSTCAKRAVTEAMRYRCDRKVSCFMVVAFSEFRGFASARDRWCQGFDPYLDVTYTCVEQLTTDYLNINPHKTGRNFILDRTAHARSTQPRTNVNLMSIVMVTLMVICRTV